LTVNYKKEGRHLSLQNSKQTIFSNASTVVPFRPLEDETNDFKIQPLMPNMLSYSGPQMAKADVNNDGLEDLYICGTQSHGGSLLLQTKSGDFVESKQSEFERDALSDEAGALFFDADKDGDMDLFVVRGGYGTTPEGNSLQDRLYINDNGVFKMRPASIPAESLSGSCVKAADIDADGDLDLFVGSRVVPSQYPNAPENMLLINNGNGEFTNAITSVAGSLQNIGMVTDAVWSDLNKDGRPDLIVCGEWMKIYCFENRNGQLVDATSTNFPTPYYGWWNRLVLADLDNDGDMDLVAANWGTNSQIKASQQEPASLFYNDFDNNGSIDPILCYYIQGKSYPMASRDEITDQIVSLRQKFPTYDSYSEATITDIFTPEQLQTAKSLKADFFETAWFENRGGVFNMHHLPVQASYAPVYAIGIEDYDHDGKKDLLLAGNIEHTRIKIGKIDASYGVFLKGDGKGNFTYLPQTASGLNVKGCVRSLVSITNAKKENIVVFGINGQLPVVYKF